MEKGELSLQERGGEPDIQNNPLPVPDNDALDLLGSKRKADISYAEDIHIEIASRWEDFLKSGIERDEKKKIMDIYPIVGNCKLLAAPRLNVEIQSTMEESVLRQDAFLGRTQDELGAAISALAIPLDKLFSQPSEESKDLLKHIANAAKLLTNVHHSLSSHRRHIILPKVNPTIRKSIEQFPIDELLFGQKFADQLKSTKELKKTSLELKIANPKQKFQSKNYKRPWNKSKFKQKGKYQDQKTIRKDQRSRLVRRKPETYTPSRFQP